MLRKINRKSDFDFILSLLGSDGQSLGWQEANWELTLYSAQDSKRSFAYKASYAFGECSNCHKSEDGQIEVFVDNHEFPVGELLFDLEIEMPDLRYPDRNRNLFIPAQKTGVEFVDDRGLASVSGLEIPVSVPLLTKKEEDKPAEEDPSGEKDPKSEKPEAPSEDEGTDTPAE